MKDNNWKSIEATHKLHKNWVLKPNSNLDILIYPAGNRELFRSSATFLKIELFIVRRCVDERKDYPIIWDYFTCAAQSKGIKTHKKKKHKICSEKKEEITRGSLKVPRCRRVGMWNKKQIFLSSSIRLNYNCRFFEAKWGKSRSST